MDVGAHFKNAYQLLSRHAVPLVLGTVIAFAIGFVVQAVLSAIPGLDILGPIVGGVIGSLLMMGLAVMAVSAVDGGEPSIEQLFVTFKSRQLDYLLVGLAVASGVLLCGIGVIVTSILFMLAPFEVVDGRGWQEALKDSYERVTANFGPHAMVWLVCAGLNLVGSAIVVGALVTVPLSLLLLGSFYRESAAPRVIEAEIP